jgi:WD40 repeat protein
MSTKLLLSSLCLILLVGCSSASPTVLLTEPIQTSSPVIPTATLTPKPVNTQTPTRVLPTSTDLPIRTCENNGFPIGSASDLKVSGEVLLLSTDLHRLDTLNLETRSVSTIYYDNDSELSVFGSSPDGNWLAYAIRTYDSNADMDNEFTLELLSQNGERIQHQMNVSPFEPLFHPDVFAGFGSSYWINNDLVYTTLGIEYRNAFGSTWRPTIPVIFNPLTGSWEQDLLSIQHGAEREIGFSPDLQRVILQTGSRITLKDLGTEKSLWNTDEFFLRIPESKIRWAPNGNIVALANRIGEPKIFLVTADGTKLDTLLPIGNTKGFLDFEWSPHSQYLMLYHSYGDELKQFYLYDMVKGQIVFACPVQQPWQVLFEWSPDSSQVIYGTDEASLLLLDIPSGKVFKLEIENVLPYSWTSKPFLH